MWRGAQDQKIRQVNSTSNTKDKNEPNDAEGVTLPRIVRLFLMFGPPELVRILKVSSFQCLQLT